jgi:beta-xylosidase
MQARWQIGIVILCLVVGASLVRGTAVSSSYPSETKHQRKTHTVRRGADKPSRGEWGDQGNATYVNPVMPGDFSDLDAIREGDDYFAISSTMQYSPGLAILHSKDLVNWEIIGHVVADLTTLDPELNWDKMSRAGRGIWAGAIRYHEQRFWIYFGTPDQGIFMSTAATPAGPWTRPKLLLDGAGWDDPCPFWDDDGKGYLVTSHFAPEGPAGTKYNIHLFELNAAGDEVRMQSDQIIHRSEGSEANKLYKIQGLYFHYYSEVVPEGRVIMMERSHSLKGPWKIHQLIHVNPAVDKEPNQGGLVQLPSGKWYFVTHQGRGDWEGRAGVLLPVTWIDGWPIIGRVGADGIGNMVWTGTKPIQGFPKTNLSASDDFSGPTLKPAWEWDYQPRVDMWSLTERPGYLRLHAFPPLRPNDLTTTGNILTQRSYRTKHNEVVVKLDLSGMVDGQESGIAHFAATYGTLGVVQTTGVRRLSYNQNGNRVAGPVISGKTLFLRSEWGFDGSSIFYYSLDGSSYTSFGDAYPLSWGSYRGDRIGIFTTNESATPGYLDVDFFRYSIER